MWRILGVALCAILLWMGPVCVCTIVGGAQKYWRRALMSSLPGSSPLGWKLEPRLSRALEKALRHYVGLWQRVIWRPLAIGQHGVFYLLLAGSASSAVTNSASGIAGGVAVVILAASAAVSALYVVTRRATKHLVTVVLSLASLFRGNYQSTLRRSGRTLPLTVSLDTQLLALLFFAAALLLMPALGLSLVLLALFDLPAYAARRALNAACFSL